MVSFLREVTANLSEQTNDAERLEPVSTLRESSSETFRGLREEQAVARTIVQWENDSSQLALLVQTNAWRLTVTNSNLVARQHQPCGTM